MYHDPISGDGLLVQFQTTTLWSYNPDARLWTKLSPEGAPMPTGNRRLAYFDPAHDVFVVIDGTTVWASSWSYMFQRLSIPPFADGGIESDINRLWPNSLGERLSRSRHENTQGGAIVSPAIPQF
jgi:hypothetical protein